MPAKVQGSRDFALVPQCSVFNCCLLYRLRLTPSFFLRFHDIVQILPRLELPLLHNTCCQVLTCTRPRVLVNRASLSSMSLLGSCSCQGISHFSFGCTGGMEEHHEQSVPIYYRLVKCTVDPRFETVVDKFDGYESRGPACPDLPTCLSCPNQISRSSILSSHLKLHASLLSCRQAKFKGLPPRSICPRRL